MKVLREIGIGKAVRFGLLSLPMALYGVLIFPQLRSAFLRVLGARIGANVIVHATSFFNFYRAGFRALHIGRSCFIGDECLIDLASSVTMEEEVTLAERVTILTHCNVGYKSHPLQHAFPPVTSAVTIRKGSFIGANATILPGVKIGPEAFVAAGSVVTEDVPARTLVAGVPARKIRDIPPGPH